MIAGLNRYATLPDADMQHWHCWLGIIPMSQVLRVELAVFALPAPGARSIQTTSHEKRISVLKRLETCEQERIKPECPASPDVCGVQ